MGGIPVKDMKQLGFDLVYEDPELGAPVPWAIPSPELLSRIKNAPWKIVDIETTGLNPASLPQKLSAKEVRHGADATLRQRVLSVLYAHDSELVVDSFDFDALTEEERRACAESAMTNVVIGHNVGFDAYWLCLRTEQRPKLLLDTMLIARILRPDHPVRMAKMLDDESIDESIRREIHNMFIQGRSGWSLADLALGVLGRLLPKDLQGPKNWCQPFLSYQAYKYATDDVRVTFDLLLKLFDLEKAEVAQAPALLLARYNELKLRFPALTIVEPQVADVMEMRLHGMPWSREDAEAYVAKQREKVRQMAEQMVLLEPSLKNFLDEMADFDKGVSAELKKAIGAAFASRGLNVEVTEKSGSFKIGEKDLRRVKAAINPEAAALFEAWATLNRAKKAGGMCREFTGFAERSPDGRLHPNTGHGPVTGRLSSSEPNCQQMPRDQNFRNCVRARKGFKICASDYSALDMRVGAALAIRAQRQMLESYLGVGKKVEPDVYAVLARCYEDKITYEQAQKEEVDANQSLQRIIDNRHLADTSPEMRKRYWNKYREVQRAATLATFQRCLRYVLDRAAADGTDTWGSLRDAFAIPGMDIHTWTALSMTGRDPKALFAGLTPEKVAAELKRWKKELGDVRQTGKVGNLSLLYAMKAKGLMDTAAKAYNIHWTLEEAEKVRNDWLAAYVEIDLWHHWTELTPVGHVYVPDIERGGVMTRKPVYASYTLGNRLIYAFGLNAALSYEDQSTGADILGRVMYTLRTQHPEIFATTINQVHDEMVFEVPADKEAEYTETIARVMTECAEYYLAPYGVRGECSPAVGDVWLKD